MTAYVTIPVDTVKNAMKLPNTALRYKPPMTAEEILAIYKQYGIDESEQKQAAGEPAGGWRHGQWGASCGSDAESASRAKERQCRGLEAARG